MKLSQKRKTVLYEAVHDPIIDARIEMERFLEGKLSPLDWAKANDILFRLSQTAPKKAVEVFN